MTISAFADDLKIGAASVKVTPPIGTPMAGYYYERGVEGIHDDLYAKALVIEKDGTKIAIVECDFVDISEYIVAKVRKLVEESTGIDAGHVMIGATHSHTGPVIPSDPASINIGDDSKGEGGQILAGYIPDRKAYAEGNYEPTSTRAAAGSGEILVENALRMLNELKNKK